MNSSVENSDNETIRFIDEAIDKLWDLRGVPTFDPVKLSDEALRKAIEINYAFGIARCTLSRGMGLFVINHDIVNGPRMIDEAIAMFREQDNKKWIANSLLTRGIVYNNLGNREAALYNALKGLEYYENTVDDRGADWVMASYITGTIYKDLKKYSEAEKLYREGIKSRDADNCAWGGRIYAGLSNIYFEEQKFDLALEFSFKGLAILQAEQNNIGESRALTDIGLIYKKLNDPESALNYLFRGLKIRENHKVHQFIVNSHIEIANIYFETGKNEDAILYFEKAEKIAVEINQLSKLSIIYQSFSSLYKSLHDYKTALTYSEKLLSLNAELSKKETEKKIDTLQNTLVKEKTDEIERLKNVELKNAYHLISEKKQRNHR